MLAAMEQFEAYQHKFPDAELRFRVYPRKDETDMSQLLVFIADRQAGTHVGIDVAPDGSFTLPVLEDARQHDADVRTNMLDGRLAWYIQIQRAGVDPRHRVLGDIREACRLELGGANLSRTIKPPALYALAAVTDACTFHSVIWGAFAERPVFAVHLTHGNQHDSLVSDHFYGANAPSVLNPLLDFTDRKSTRLNSSHAH